MKKRARFRREIKYKGYEIYYQPESLLFRSGYKIYGVGMAVTTLKECKWRINQWIKAKKMIDGARKAGAFYL